MDGGARGRWPELKAVVHGSRRRSIGEEAAGWRPGRNRSGDAGQREMPDLVEGGSALVVRQSTRSEIDSHRQHFDEGSVVSEIPRPDLEIRPKTSGVVLDARDATSRSRPRNGGRRRPGMVEVGVC